MLNMLGTMYWWSVADISSGQRILRAAVAARTASREKSEHILHPAVSPRTIRNSLLAAELGSRVRLSDYHLHHDTAKHGYSGVVKESTGEWNGALLYSVKRVGSVCVRVMNVDEYGVDLVSVIFRIAFAHDTQASP